MATCRYVLGTVVVLGLLSCRTVPNVSTVPIQVPAGLAAGEVEYAILMGIGVPTETPGLSPGQQITDNLLSSVWGRYNSAAPRREPLLYFEAREAGAVFAGFQHRHFYMRVKIRFDDREIALRVVESRNLRQTETRIHRWVLPHLRTLENRIRVALGKVAHRNAYGGKLD